MDILIYENAQAWHIKQIFALAQTLDNEFSFVLW